jgi:hypothetical protein
LGVESAQKEIKRMQTVRKTKDGHKRWTQKRKGGITDLVKKAQFSFGRILSDGDENNAVNTVQNISRQSASTVAKNLPLSANSVIYSYEPTNKERFLIFCK